MEMTDNEIIYEALKLKTKHPNNIWYDAIYDEIIISPINRASPTWILEINGSIVTLCCKPGCAKIRDLADPTSITEITKELDHCIEQDTCLGCERHG